MFSPMPEANPRPTLRTEALFAGRVLALNVSSDSRLIPFDKQASASGRRRTAVATAPVPAPSPSPSTELPGTALLEGLKRQGARSACWYGVVSRPVPGLPDALVIVPSGRSWTGSSRPAVDAVWSLIAVPAGMPFGDRWAAARYAPVLDFRIDRLSNHQNGITYPELQECCSQKRNCSAIRERSQFQELNLCFEWLLDCPAHVASFKFTPVTSCRHF